MAEHPNVALLRKGYEAFATGDMETMASILSEDVVWHATGRNVFSGDYKGVEETLTYFGKLVERTGGTFKADMHTVLADDDHAVGMHHDTAERDGKRLDVNEVLVMHVRDGKIFEAWELFTDPYAYDEFLT
jgi:ketosteroid isomerase-like protein